MDPQTSNGWPTSSGPGPPSSNNEHQIPLQQRSFGSFPSPRSIHPLNQSQTQISGQPLIPQSGPSFPASSNGHALPIPTNIAQASPLQQSRVSAPPQQQQQRSPPGMQSHQVQAPTYSLPAIGSTLPQQPQQSQQQLQHSPQTTMNIEREREREREHEMERQRQDLMMQRDYERFELREQSQRDQHSSPRENHTGSIPLQQPVASRVPATLHGPNGILSHLGAGSGPNPPPPAVGAPNGPPNSYSSGMQSAGDSSPRSFAPQAPPQQALGFANAVTAQQLPNGMAALSQGQQPILNDALSYLDQVKVRFVDHPDVYNRFLDIMKDFKSQAIDTPGVIDRVSQLFAGHPELIQGFNTFLPPGYRIECGTRDDPNTIRVTTPMGTTVSQMPSAHNRLNGTLNGVQINENLGAPARQAVYVDAFHSNGDMQSQQQDQADNLPESNFNSSGRVGIQSMYSSQPTVGPAQTTYNRDEAEAAAIAHQQEQRGVSHLSNAVSAVTTNGSVSRQTMAQVSPSGGQAASLNHATLGPNGAGTSLTPGPEKRERGPVEFNHAIGYVNKIKNRFASQPDIYKQFLEILQTYQRDLKPIQDVYAQVTQLFSSAPDLLEDFKQFLPESAAQAKAQAAARQATEDAATLNNLRGDPSYISSMHPSQSQTPKPEMRMPPVGNFAPPSSAGKDNKKRRGGAGTQITVGTVPLDTQGPGSQIKASNIRTGPSNKRAKVEPQKLAAPDLPPVSPTLIPSVPRPMLPKGQTQTLTEEVAFFDRAKKYMNSKHTFNEFLKLCNLFTQDMIDKNTLIHKASGFIGGNTDLIGWLKNFLDYRGADEIFENKPKLGGDKVVLSNCRGLGPSYRLLPKRERLRQCSGRDELCQRVLNDEWVSHPTWASEDSGFIAHRKNTFEDAIHRIEEERHDYDFNIEACLRTIQLIEPIVQQLGHMTDEERMAYVLPPGIGGQSETIYQRVIKKIYDRRVGQDVINEMFRWPSRVLPIVLARLKQKVEEWKASMREWEKVWRDQTHKMFWKSLDHQGINAKSADKRQFQPKVLHTEIQIKYEEQRRMATAPWNGLSKSQFTYYFDDKDVIHDACHLILTFLYNQDKANEDDKKRVEKFIVRFIPTFFGLDQDSLQARMTGIHDADSPNEEFEEESVSEEPNINRTRRTANGKRGNLLRGVLERKTGKDEAGRESKESTPDISSMDEDAANSNDTSNEFSRIDDPADQRWMDYPIAGPIDPRTPYQRDAYNLYGSVNVYCFFRMFQTLYERLVNVKVNEKQVHEDVARSNQPKTAHELNLTDKIPSDFFKDTSPKASYYRQVVNMCEDVMKQRIEIVHFEETLRRFYMMKGWQLYNYERMISAITRFALNILVSDKSDKSLDIINLFYTDRAKDETTHDAEIHYRKQVDKLAPKDTDIFRITWEPKHSRSTISIFKKDDPTFDVDMMEAATRWSYYISSYALRDPTEGITADKLRFPFFRRNVPKPTTSEEEYNSTYVPLLNEDGLIMRIKPETYEICFRDPGTSDWFLHDVSVERLGMEKMEEVKKNRRQKFEEKWGANGYFTKTLTKAEANAVNEKFEKWVNEGPTGEREEGARDSGEIGRYQADDETMTGT